MSPEIPEALRVAVQLIEMLELGVADLLERALSA